MPPLEIYSEAQRIILDASLSNDAVLRPNDIAKAVEHLRKYEFDSNIAIQGQNGMGKSMVAMAQGVANGDTPKHILDRFIYAYHTYQHAIRILNENFDKQIYFDELATFMPYKLAMTRAQVDLISQIENVRSHRNCIIGCCRDLQRINNNYRNGKVFLTIFLIGRYTEPEFNEGVVLIGSPLIETEDKFFMSQLRPTYDLNDMARQLERLPSFAGYIYYDDIRRLIPKSVLKKYAENKEEGIQYGTKSRLARMTMKSEKEE